MSRVTSHAQGERHCKQCGGSMDGKQKKQKFCSNRCMADSYKKDPLVAFHEKVDKGPHPKGCWIWSGAKENHGYGHFRTGGKDYRAHRYSYELSFGAIPKRMCVMHTCDVMPCVNPAHLRLGTHAENMADCLAKGRHTCGEKNGKALMTPEIVLKLRAEYQGGGPGRPSNIKELVSKYGFKQHTILAAVKGRSWRHL